MITPDRGFMRNLKQLDRRLDCVFRKEHGHFVITYDRGWGAPVNLCLVKTDDGGFRQPDMREIKYLSDGDMNNQRVQDRLLKVSKYLYESRENDRKKARELIRERTKDDKIQLMDAFQHVYGTGKHKAAFRQIG